MAVGRDERSYQHSTHPFIPAELGRLPSVTTICGLRDKSAPLMHWAVNKEREAIREAVLNVLTNPQRIDDFTSEEIWRHIEEATQGVKQAQKLKEEAAEIGSRVHALIAEAAAQRLIQPSLWAQDRPEVQHAMCAFKAWAEHSSLVLVDREQVVWSRQHRFAGTLDMVAWVDGQLTLLDFKTSNRLYDEHCYQIAAYAEAYEECRPKLIGLDYQPLRQLIVLRLSKTDGSFEPHDVTRRRAEAFRAFLGLKTVYDVEKAWSNGVIHATA